MEKLIQKKQRVLVVWVLFLFVMASASQQHSQISFNFQDGTYIRIPAHAHVNLTPENPLKNENEGLSNVILHLKKEKNEQNFHKLTRKETRQLKRELRKSIKSEIKKYIKDIKKANKWKTWQIVFLIACIVGIIVSIAFFWSTVGWIVTLVLLCLGCAVGGCGSGSSGGRSYSSGNSSGGGSSGQKCRAITCNSGKVYTTNGTYTCLRCNGTGVE